ncbi:MAG: membrane protein insertase YidC [Geminicoccaceae bacterium]
MSEQRNLVLAIILSVGIILAWQFLYEIPRLEQQRAQMAVQEMQEAARPDSDATLPAPNTAGASLGDASGAAETPVSRDAALAEADRVRIDNGRLHGSLNLKGARLDDITLADYHETIDPNSPEIILFSPSNGPAGYFAEFGWVAREEGVALPDAETVWQASGGEIGQNGPVTLLHDNGEGLRFSRTVNLDDNYMFTLTRSVTNDGDTPVTLFPYGLISRHDTPATQGIWILHEGPIGVLQDTLEEVNYGELRDEGVIAFEGSTGGWLGITDKYWLAALVPDQTTPLTGTFRHTMRDNRDRYQSDYLGGGLTVQPGQTVQVTDRIFVGAKEVRLLDAYSQQYSIPLFDRAVDFGWFYFITKPFFYALNYLNQVFSNYGVAILILTLGIKIVFFPLANKSYVAMSKMKALQPEMLRLREKHEDDKMKLNQEMMALYKREKVNPAAGCLPILIQIPIFFSLYKVLFVSIEMRHAPFFGWIQDLSAPDPLSIFNLFGLLPFEVPAFLVIGIWPLLMGATMWLQTKLNPAPTDPMQARIMAMLPFMFIFLFATFPAGLVIYWTWNNVLSIGQQWLIMRRMGVKLS